MLGPGDRLMALSGKSGGHFSHGFQTPDGQKAISNKFFDTRHYEVSEDGIIDYDKVFKMAKEFKPQLITCGYSVHTHDLDYQYFSKIATSVGAYLHLDMAHIAGLIAAGIFESPFKYIDVATSTTHKTLRGPRGGLVLCKKKISKLINQSVFPGIQGGPQNHTIAGLAIALGEANTEDFKDYQKRVVENAKMLGSTLVKSNEKVRGNTGNDDHYTTNNHMVIWEPSQSIGTTKKFEQVCESLGITLNAIRINGSVEPNSIRVGSMACTTLGYSSSDMQEVAKMLVSINNLTNRVLESVDEPIEQYSKLLEKIKKEDEYKSLKIKVKEMALQFTVPGI